MTPVADCQRCDALLSLVLADKRPVDIYLVEGESNDQKRRNWAQQYSILAELARYGAPSCTIAEAAGCATTTASCRFFAAVETAGIPQHPNRCVVPVCHQL